MSTIVDVARLAGVGTTTVTKVLANRPHVRAETRQRVLHAIAALDYYPNSAGQTLRSSTPRVIGVVTPAPQTDPFSYGFFPVVFGGIGEWAAEQEYDVLWITATSKNGIRPAYAALYKSRRVAGIIDLCITLGDPRVAALKVSGCPFVLIGNPDDPTLPSVDADNEAAGRAVATAFLERGYTSAGFIGAANSPAARDRLVGLRATFEAAGYPLARHHTALGEPPPLDPLHGTLPDGALAPDPSRPARHTLDPSRDIVDAEAGRLAWAPWSEEFGYQTMRRWIADDDWPRAIFTFADDYAVGALRACQEAALRVPEDVAFVGFGDEAGGRWLRPALATVRQSTHELGYRAGALLLQLIAGTIPPDLRVMVPTRLIVRESLG